MATPDSIDRQQPAAGAWNPFPWAVPVQDRTVLINPSTRQAVEATDPTQIAGLLAQGFTERVVVPGANWGEFLVGMGENFVSLPSGETQVPAPGLAPLSPEEIANINGAYGNINAQAGASQENIQKAYDISQPSRDRAALQAKEAYQAAILPTMAAGAFAGAGYHQPLQQVFENAQTRVRNLAGLADENTSALFQVSVNQQQTERERQAALQNAYNQAVAANQNRYDQGVDRTLAWIK